jgi:hypothetical protein
MKRGLIKRAGLAAALALAAGGASAQDEGAQRTVAEGLVAEVTAEGLSVLAAVARESVGDQLRDIAIPDVTNDVGAGVTATLTGAHASMQMEPLGLAPTADGLALDVGLSDVAVAIPSMRLEWTVLGLTVGTTCTDTVLHLGEDGTVTLNGVLAAAVVDESIRLAPGAMSFPVGYDDYRAEGPAACSGIWGVRDVTRLVLSGVLKLLWPFVEDTVTSRIADAVPAVEASLNEQTHLAVMLDVGGRPPFPIRTAELSAFPSRITTTGEALRIVAGFRIRSAELEGLPARRARGELEGVGVRLASFGLNPSLVSEAVAVVYPDGTESTELTAEAIPSLADVLKVRSLAGIWPDLNQAPLTGSSLRLFVRLLEPPTIAADAATQAVRAKVPRLEMRFLAPIGGAWVDYYTVELDLEAGVQPTVASGELRLSLLDDYRVAIRGRWADAYVPTTDLFEADMFGVVVSTLFDYAQAAGPLTRVAIPAIDVGGRLVGLEHPHVRGDLLRVDAVAR